MCVSLLAVVPGYYLVCYNRRNPESENRRAVVPGYYLVCYNRLLPAVFSGVAVVPGYYLVCYNTPNTIRPTSML